jgi:phage gp36-like protein
MFITTDEFNTHIYQEIIDAVSREDEDILQASIDAALSEMKGYLSDYNIDEIFSATGDDRHPLLLTFVKDITVWHFLNLANPSADLELRKVRYERAVDWLRGVQKGNIVPDLPVKESEDGEQVGSIRFGSNTQRENHY